MTEVKAVIKDLKPNKAQGYDGIKDEVLEMMFNSNPNLMLNLHNNIQSKQIYSDNWFARVALIPNLSRASSNRPIYLLPIQVKSYDRIVTRRLVIYLESNGLLNSNQFGFRGKKSTIDAFHVMDNIIENEKQGYYLSHII